MTKEKGFPIDRLPLTSSAYTSSSASFSPSSSAFSCVNIPGMTQHIVSSRKLSFTNWTLHVGGLPSPVNSSYKLLTVVYRNEAEKKRNRP
jgi:hypothetical protein